MSGFLESYANTDKYRIMWRDNPSTTMIIGWNQVSGSNPVVYYGTIDNGTDWSAYADSKAADRAVVYKGDRKSVVKGKSVSVRVDLGGRRIIKKTKEKKRK